MQTPDFDAAKNMVELTNATKDAAIATIVGAMIAASGRPHSTSEVATLMRDIRWTIYPDRNYGSYQAWQKEHNAEKVHS